MVVDQQLAAGAATETRAQPQRAGWLRWLWAHEWLVIVLLLAWATFILAWRLNVPDQYIYDEVYHAFTGNLMAHNDPKVYEWWQSAPQEPIQGVQYEWTHPPLGKLIIGGSIWLFGNNSIGWRFGNMVFGILCVGLLYLFARVLFRDRVLATFAAFIISIEGLMFAESRIGTNDIFQLAFLLAAYACFSKFFHRPARDGLGWLLLTGIFLGLGLATKWPSIYSIVLLGAIAFVRGFLPVRRRRAIDTVAAPLDEPNMDAAPVPSESDGTRYLHSRARLAYAAASSPTSEAAVSVDPTPATHEPSWGFFPRLGYLAVTFGAFILIPAGEYVLSYLQMFLQRHEIPTNYAGVGPFNLGPIHLPAYTLPDSSWRSMFLGEQWQMWHYHTTLTASHPYYSKWWQWLLDIRPVFYYVNRSNPSWVQNTYNLGNPLLYWFFPLAIVAAIVFIFRRRDKALLLVLGAFVINWAVWAASPRGLFFYHFLPSVPFVVLMVAYGLTRLWRSGSRWGRRLAFGYVALIFVSFAFFYPQLSAYPQPYWYADIHYWLPSWQ